MSLPKPEPGLVFRYDYLWSREAKRGQITGKDRPACVAIMTDAEAGPQIVVILPITHSKPSGDSAGIEIPESVRRQLGLDDSPCWVIVSEHNTDEWPNSGISPLPGSKTVFAYGFLPPRLFGRVRSEFLKRFDRRRNVRR
jgi:hypothetical protein